MKQKVVIRVTLNQTKSRPKVLQLVVGFPGIESAKWEGKEGDQVEVVGDGIDAIKITTLLRKKIGYADVISVNPVAEKKDKPNEQKQEQKNVTTHSAPLTYVHHPVWSEYPVTGYGTPGYMCTCPPPPVTQPYSTCSIM